MRGEKKKNKTAADPWLSTSGCRTIAVNYQESAIQEETRTSRTGRVICAPRFRTDFLYYMLLAMWLVMHRNSGRSRVNWRWIALYAFGMSLRTIVSKCAQLFSIRMQYQRLVLSLKLRDDRIVMRTAHWNRLNGSISNVHVVQLHWTELLLNTNTK